jgi:hypothetical protein
MKLKFPTLGFSSFMTSLYTQTDSLHLFMHIVKGSHKISWSCMDIICAKGGLELRGEGAFLGTF